MTAALLDRSEENIIAAAPLRRLAERRCRRPCGRLPRGRRELLVTGCVIPVDGGLAINTWGQESEWR